MPWKGPVAAWVPTPETWVVDNEPRSLTGRPEDTPQFMSYPLGHTRDSAFLSGTFIYGKIVLKTPQYPTMESIAEMHEKRIAEWFRHAVVERLEPSRRESLLRVTHIETYKGPEYSLYIDHPRGVLLLVLLCPKGREHEYVDILKEMGKQAIVADTEPYDVTKRLIESPDPATRAYLAQGLISRAASFFQAGQLSEALSTYDKVLSACQNDPTPEVAEKVALALLEKSITLRFLGDQCGAVRAADEVLSRFGEWNKRYIDESLSKALVNKGLALNAMGQSEGAIESFKIVISRFGASENPVLFEPIAMALLDMGNTLLELGQPEPGLRAYKELIERFTGKLGLGLQELTVRAIGASALALSSLGRHEEADTEYDRVTEACKDILAPWAEMHAAKAIWGKARSAEAQGDTAGEIKLYEEISARFAATQDQEVKETVAMSLVNRAYRLKPNWQVKRSGSCIRERA